jgi:hypothetical protein
MKTYTARLEAKLELITELLETARELVKELECGETVETETDADHALAEARGLARTIQEDSWKANGKGQDNEAKA